MESTAPGHSGAEGVGADAQTNVYGAVVRRQTRERHVKKGSFGALRHDNEALLLDASNTHAPHTGSGGE